MDLKFREEFSSTLWFGLNFWREGGKEVILDFVVLDLFFLVAFLFWKLRYLGIVLSSRQGGERSSLKASCKNAASSD